MPSKMRKETIDRIYGGHLGLNKCRRRAQGSVWWPAINSEMNEKIKNCIHCRVHKPAQRKEPLMPTPLPQHPWQRIAADFCEVKGRRYLVVTDYFSRWLEIVHMPSTNTQLLISKLKCPFARLGISDQFVTDNGPQFCAQEFATFAADYYFQHITSSPYFAQANGAAECAVQTAKKILIQEDPFLALVTYHATPIEAMGVSPAQLIMGR